MRSFQERQAQLDRELDIWRSKYNAAMQISMNEAGYGHEEGMGAAACRANAYSRWQATVRDISAATESMSTEARNQKLREARDARDAELRNCG
jgi:hypothetical protein